MTRANRTLPILLLSMVLACARPVDSDSNTTALLLALALSRPASPDLDRWTCRATGTTADYRVIAVHQAASDQTQSEIDNHVRILRTAMAAVRSFYSDSMGDGYGRRTCDCTDVRVLTSTHTKAEWDNFGLNGYTRKNGTTTSP